MKTINIYLASSEELKKDKTTIGNLVGKLDDNYSKRGVRIKLVDSDDFIDDDEKLSDLKGSQMFVALFHKTADSVSIEEFDNALDELKKKNFPKVYVYCRDLVGYDAESPELVDFKKKLYDELGYYWCRYGNEDTLQLNFIMQIQHIETDCNVKLEVKDGVVKIGNEELANLANVPFIANNVDFQKNKKEVFEIGDRIEKLRIKIEKYPDDEDFRNDLDKLLPKYKELKKNIEKEEEYIFKSALEIAKLQQGIITDQKRRAIEAFERGEVKEANIILKEAILNADEHFEELEKKRQIFEKGKEIGRQYVDDAILNAVIMMADSSIQINERITRADDLYEKACKWAEKSDYEEYKYIELLKEYYNFSYYFAHYDKALEILKKRQAIIEKTKNDSLYFTLCFDYSLLYQSIGDFAQSLEYARKTLDQMLIKDSEKIVNYDDLANVYTLIGNAYANQFDADKNEAVKYYEQALSIYNTLGDDYKIECVSVSLNLGVVEDVLRHTEKASKCFDYVIDNEKILNNIIEKTDDFSQKLPQGSFYKNLGIAYNYKELYDKSIYYLKLANDIFNEILGDKHPMIGEVCLYLASSYTQKKHYEEAFCLYQKSLNIYSTTFGCESVQLAAVYDSMSGFYKKQKKYDEALDVSNKSLSLYKKKYGAVNSEVADAYSAIADIYYDKKDLGKTLECYNNSLKIRIELYGQSSIEVADSLKDIGWLYQYGFDNYRKALSYYKKALKIYLKSVGENCEDIAELYADLASIYVDLEDFTNGLLYQEKALKVNIDMFGDNSKEVADSYSHMGDLYNDMADFDKAKQYYNKSLAIYTNNYECDEKIAYLYEKIGGLYELEFKKYNTAIEYYSKCLDIYINLSGNYSLEIALIYEYIGSSYDKLYLFDESFESYDKALSLRLNVLNPNDKLIAETYNCIANTHRHKREYKDAIEFYNKSIDII